MTKLDDILASTRARVAQARETADLRFLETAAKAHIPRGFRRRLLAMSQLGPAVIAELKKASPSRGLLRSNFSVEALACQLARSGASALSVLTDEPFFQGSLTNLQKASEATDLPCLRKDFIVDEFQLLEARAYRADAVLLILAALDTPAFHHLLKQAMALELDVLCEVHDPEELKRALDAGAEIIGVNARDLRTLQVNLENVIELSSLIPNHMLRVAESGISSGAEIRELHSYGYQAFLIGESLMRADDPGKRLQQLLQEAGWYSQSPATSPGWRGTVQ